MWTLLSPRVWLAVAVAIALSASLWKAYVMGKQTVQNDWNLAITTQAQETLKLSEEYRLKEQALQTKVRKAQNEAATRVKKLQTDADNARAASDGLRNDLAAFRTSLPSLTRDAIDRYAVTAGVVFDECVRKYLDVARDADSIASERQLLVEAWPTK